MTLQDRFKLISKRMLVDFEEAGLGRHPGAKGTPVEAFGMLGARLGGGSGTTRALLVRLEQLQ